MDSPVGETPQPRLFWSVLVPVRNAAPFIAECLRSIAAQNFPSWECIVMDDASTDGTLDVIRAEVGTDPRFRIMEQEERQTALPNLMAMIRAARGDYIAIVDGDDWLDNPGVLAGVYQVYEDCADVIMTSGSYRRHPSGEMGHCRPAQPLSEWWNRWNWGHLLTWERRYSLESFAEEPQAYIDLESGKPYQSAYDLALVFPVAARADWHDKKIVHVRDCTYWYRRHDGNDDADEAGLRLQTLCATKISLYWANRMAQHDYQKGAKW